MMSNTVLHCLLTHSLLRDVCYSKRSKNDHAGGQGRIYVQPQFRFTAFVTARPLSWQSSHVSEVSSSSVQCLLLSILCLVRCENNSSFLHAVLFKWGKLRCGCSLMRHTQKKLVQAVCLMAFDHDDGDGGKEGVISSG